jgi:hypothetical protein
MIITNLDIKSTPRDGYELIFLFERCEPTPSSFTCLPFNYESRPYDFSRSNATVLKASSLYFFFVFNNYNNYIINNKSDKSKI